MRTVSPEESGGHIVLERFIEGSGVLPTTQFLIGKVWAPVMHFVCRIYCKVHWVGS